MNDEQNSNDPGFSRVYYVVLVLSGLLIPVAVFWTSKLIASWTDMLADFDVEVPRLTELLQLPGWCWILSGILCLMCIAAMYPWRRSFVATLVSIVILFTYLCVCFTAVMATCWPMLDLISSIK